MTVIHLVELCCAGLMTTALACGDGGSVGGGGSAGGDARPRRGGEEAAELVAEDASPQPRLAPDQLRVALVVLPGDAEVEVDGVAVRRRDGAIDLVGKAHERRRVRVFKGADTLEQDVTVETSGASPASLDLDAKVVVRGGASPDAGAKDQAAPAAATALPSSFE